MWVLLECLRTGLAVFWSAPPDAASVPTDWTPFNIASYTRIGRVPPPARAYRDRAPPTRGWTAPCKLKASTKVSTKNLVQGYLAVTCGTIFISRRDTPLAAQKGKT